MNTVYVYTIQFYVHFSSHLVSINKEWIYCSNADDSKNDSDRLRVKMSLITVAMIMSISKTLITMVNVRTVALRMAAIKWLSSLYWLLC